ncbi:uncharacterized protein LOC119665129, partial [Teleopsis dalmanni]|uniref:uncharacterized protein LOC119665129 n=1 Tax=Teleopsis dalmanni TaxID=139649 RepID=UPI0018CCC6A2
MVNRQVEQPSTYYSIKAASLEGYMVDLTANNTTLWEATDESIIEDYTLEMFYELEEKAGAAMIELQQHLHNNQTIRNSRQTDCKLPLPRISLPKFDGNYMRWVEFKDLYMELVHNTDISDSKKMHYLTTSLDNEPKGLIRHLPVVGENYNIAWTLLTSRYENKRLLVTTLLNKLMGQSSIKRESAPALKSLHDVSKECIHGLKAQGVPVEHWDIILVHLLLRKLDAETLTAFEQGLTDNKRLITIDELLKFLEHRFQSLEARGKGDSSFTRTCASATKFGLSKTCPICNKDGHMVYACKKFETANLSQRWNWVKEFNLCVNCLRIGHRADECNSRHCTKCSKKHNTLMHNPKGNQYTKGTVLQGNNSTPQQTGQASVSNQSSNKITLLTNNTRQESNYVLLGTARIRLLASNGRQIECRAVLDSGSQINLITNRLSQKLGCKPRPTLMSMEGVGANESKIRHQTIIRVQSTLNEFVAEMDAHIIPKIVSDQPMQYLNIESWDIPKELTLADPDFNKPGRIDCLLGAEIFFKLLIEGQIKLAGSLPTLQNSIFGWVVAGNVETLNSSTATCGICTTKELEESILKFWESEEIPDSTSELTEDELRCESHFLQHTFRGSDGRFVVKLPLKNHPSVLPDTKGIAYERFKTIERRFIQNPDLKNQYVSFMREYEALGHMTKFSGSEIISPQYFIPHHCVLRPDSSTSKLRVVFDASVHKLSEPSLNDIMFNGPKVQDELFSILLRFRMHKYVLKTDVEKMYRQIWVNKDDRNLQLIMWRENPTEPLNYYQLNTVTYGTRAAPYLATRCLTKLADEYQGNYLYGATSLKKDFYVDDGLIGADTINEALLIQQQLITILDKAGMKLKKWCANNPKLLHGIATEDQEVNLNFDSKETQFTKTLGLLWLPKSDSFRIKVNSRDHSHTTKRSMSSDLAHIYDPLGLIGPILVTGKILLQGAWQLKLDWDDDLPSEIRKQWTSYREDLALLDNATVVRHVFSSQGYSHVELHAFCDASEKAYGAAVYIRTVQKDKTIKLNLLCSRSRVAPIKSQTIPRLELCAALLAAELMARVKLDLGYQDKATYFWTDSQIVLSWINNHPGKLPVYVAHRIVKILRLTIPEQWRHVPSKQNPADILSRGLKPREFSSCYMWLYGPLFLYQPKPLWPAPFKRELIVEDNTVVLALSAQQPTNEHAWVYSIHSRNLFTHVQKVVGYVLRFTKNARKPKESRPETMQLSPMELDVALKIIIRQIQASDFSDLRKMLVKDEFVPKTHNLSSLTPFVDEEGVIRVGGRLSSSKLQFDAIHQMILPSNDPLVKLLVEEIHKDNYHCGAQALLAQVRQRFWPLKGKSLMRAVIQQCLRCRRARPIVYNQIMGNLPGHRVQPARPFLSTGVDYCGPIWVHYKTRGKRPQKAYIAVFCCFATKAVHLELVTDLTTDAFIGALKRFIARRGRCKTLYCDNATNFVGAKNKLQELTDVIYADRAKESIAGMC